MNGNGTKRNEIETVRAQQLSSEHFGVVYEPVK